jgi:hypothetical protein
MLGQVRGNGLIDARTAARHARKRVFSNSVNCYAPHFVVGRAKGSNDPSPLFLSTTAAFGLAAGSMHAGRLCRRHVFGTTACLFSKLTSPCRYRTVACS